MSGQVTFFFATNVTSKRSILQSRYNSIYERGGDGMSTDRRAGPKQGPYVDKQPRARNDNGQWRKKRSDAGKPRSDDKKKS